MKNSLLGLVVTLSAAVAIYQPGLAQSSEEPVPESSAQSSADDTSVDSNDDAEQTTRSSQESTSEQSSQSGPALTPPSPPQSVQQGRTQVNQNQQQQPNQSAQQNQAQANQNQQQQPNQLGIRPQQGQQQSVLRQPSQQPSAQQQPSQQTGQQPAQQQAGSQSLQQPPNRQQTDQQQLGSQQFDQQQNRLQLNGQQFNQQQLDQQLGIQFQQSNQVAGQGLAIRSIQPNSLFFNSGLRQGDVLLSVDNRPILNQAEFIQTIRNFPDQRIPLVVMRGGRQETIFINRPAQFGVTSQPQSVQLSQSILGVTFDSQITNAAIIRHVIAGGPAALAGLRSGDQITALNGQRISSPFDATQMISSMSPGQELIIDYSRQQMDVRTTAVLVPRTGEQVEHRVGYAPSPTTQVITPDPLPAPRQTYYRPAERRVDYYYDNNRPRRWVRRGWYR